MKFISFALCFSVIFSAPASADSFGSKNIQLAQYYGSSSFHKNIRKKQEQDKIRTYSSKPKNKYKSVYGHTSRKKIENLNTSLQRRMKPDMLRILQSPDEVECFAIKRKALQAKVPTMNGYELKGTCGVLVKQGLSDVQTELLYTEDNIDDTKKPNCRFNPDVQLRFKRGLDYVDTLISAGKCNVLKFFYAGKTLSFDAKPMESWLTKFTEGVTKDITPVKAEEPEKEEDDKKKKYKKIEKSHPDSWTAEKDEKETKTRWKQQKSGW